MPHIKGTGVDTRMADARGLRGDSGWVVAEGGFEPPTKGL